jgi:hypothetical protein
MLDSGSYTLWARTTVTANTLPSHVSMLTGVPPEVHGITWNGEMPLTRPVYSRTPTLFELAKAQGYTTAMATGKSKMAILDKPGTIDLKFIAQSDGEDPQVISHALQFLRQQRPNVMLIHLPSVDSAGHSKGWGSPEQMAAIEQADRCIGQFFDTLDELDLRRSTVVILTADHGGAGRSHGPEDPRSRTIPWVVCGPGVRAGFDLSRIGELNVETYDTFATSCAILGIPVRRKVAGKFVSQIIENQELLTPTTMSIATPATIPAAPVEGGSR